MAAGKSSEASASNQEAGTAAAGAVMQQAAALQLMQLPEQAASLLQSAIKAHCLRDDSPTDTMDASSTSQQKFRLRKSSFKGQEDESGHRDGSQSRQRNGPRCWQALQAMSWLQAGAVREAEQAAANMPLGLG